MTAGFVLDALDAFWTAVGFVLIGLGLAAIVIVALDELLNR